MIAGHFVVSVNDTDEHGRVWALRSDSDPKRLTLNASYALVDPEAELEMQGMLTAFTSQQLFFDVDRHSIRREVTS